MCSFIDVCSRCTWMWIIVFQVISFLPVQSLPLYFFPSSGTLITQMLVYLMLSQRFLKLSSFLKILFPFFSSAWEIFTTLYSSSLIWSSVLSDLLFIPWSIFFSFSSYILQFCLILLYNFQFSSVQSLSCVQLFVTPWIAARQASLSIPNSQSSLKLTSMESVMPSSHLILCRPLLLLPPIPPSIRVFSNKSTLRIRWPKYWSFSFSIISSKEHPGLISSRMDWLDLLASPRDSQESSPTPQFKIQHQFFGAQPSSQSNSPIQTWLLEKP